VITCSWCKKKHTHTHTHGYATDSKHSGIWIKPVCTLFHGTSKSSHAMTGNVVPTMNTNTSQLKAHVGHTSTLEKQNVPTANYGDNIYCYYCKLQNVKYNKYKTS
jgi:hypothetical protein